MPELTRALKFTPPLLMYGADVEACARAEIRYLHDDKNWVSFNKSPEVVRRTFGVGKRTLTKNVQAKAGIAQTGVIGPATERVLRKAAAFDMRADALLLEYSHKQAPFCYPHPLGASGHVGQWFHQTAGLPGNWAIDFMAPGDTKVLAVEDAEIVKISGHPPTYVPDSMLGIFGWNIHYWTSSGYRYFSTHYGTLKCRVGQQVKVGTVIGLVGWWPHDPGRSHTHLGVTAPKGWMDAQHRMETIARAPRVNPL